MIPATQCPSSALRVTVNKTRGGAAAGTSYVALDFTNTSGHSCHMFGFPGVSFVTGNPGSQIGAAASRQKTFGPENVTLASGAVAARLAGGRRRRQLLAVGLRSGHRALAEGLPARPVHRALHPVHRAGLLEEGQHRHPADHPADQAGARSSRQRAVTRGTRSCACPAGTSSMTRSDLVRRAKARGVAASYRDWRGREVEVGSDTLAAILDALAEPGPPAAGAFGIMPESGAAAAPPSAPRPDRRSWGFTVQLYALRSRGSWGHGDLRDLADLAAWSGRGLGAGFVLCSPLHAAEPQAAAHRVAVPADEQAVHQPALPAHRGHPRVRAARRGREGTDRRPGRAAACPQRHRGPDRQGRGVGGQAGGPGDPVGRG